MNRAWANGIVGVLFLQTLAQGCLFLVALEHLVGATWSVPLRRVPQRLATLLLPLAPLALLAVLAPYPGWPGAGKGVWLSPTWFSFRVVLVAILGLVSLRILSGNRARRFAPAFMAVFALATTQQAFDVVAGLTPGWYSDLLGIYLAAGSILAGLAATTLELGQLQARGRLPAVGDDHRYNLGALLFGFTCFWAYLAYCQYLLMWYGNLPGEAAWFQLRLQGGWRLFTWGLVTLHFLVPFAALLPRAAKRRQSRLRWVAALVLLAHFLDLVWLVFPSLGLEGSWLDLVGALLFGTGALAWTARVRHQGPDLPEGDPGLARGLEFRL